jgi:LPXTG-site transpeptidase (sortase) family protein
VQLSALCVAVVGLVCIATGVISFIIDEQDRIAAESIRPEDFDFAVTLTPPPASPSVVPVTRANAVPATPSPRSQQVASEPSTPTAVAPSPSATAAPTARPAPTATPISPEVPTRIVIPSIKLDAPIVAVKLLYKDGDPASSWQVPNKRAAGWQNLSALLGQVGNLVLNGHHNVNGRVFENLKDLKPGDVIEIDGPTLVQRYSVTERHLLLERGQSLEVQLQHARYIEPTPDQRLTLVTCWPPRDYSHRLVIIARPVQGDGDSTDNTNNSDRNQLR